MESGLVLIFTRSISQIQNPKSETNSNLSNPNDQNGDEFIFDSSLITLHQYHSVLNPKSESRSTKQIRMLEYQNHCPKQIVFI